MVAARSAAHERQRPVPLLRSRVMTAPTAFVVSQGEELLTGQTLDTNCQYLCEQLTALGFRVLGAITAGDRRDAISDAFRLAISQADAVVCTGGLGPTADDLTAEAVADVLGVELELRQDALAMVQARYASMKRVMAGSNERQAWLPRGCEVLANPVGTAPGFACDAGGTRVSCMPGVPFEMKRMWGDAVAPDLLRRFEHRPPQRHVFRVLGKGESQLQDLLGDIPERWPGVELGFRTSMPENQVKLVAEPGIAGFEAAVAAVRARVGVACFSEDPTQELAGAVGSLLLERGQRVAFAESCTGGWVSHLCVTEAGSSRWFERGWVTYSNEAKQAELGVPAALIAEHGAVSEACAVAMAEGALERSGASWAVAITGIAGPTGGTADKPVGTVWFAVAGPAGTRARKLFFPTRSRTANRRFSAFAALDLLRRQILRLPLAD